MMELTRSSRNSSFGDLSRPSLDSEIIALEWLLPFDIAFLIIIVTLLLIIIMTLNILTLLLITMITLNILNEFYWKLQHSIQKNSCT